MKRLWIAAVAAGWTWAAQAGMGIAWSTCGWIVEAGGDTDAGPGVAENNVITWQLLYAGANNVPDAINPSATGWTGGDDILLAERVVPAGGGSVADGTSWDSFLMQQGGNTTYEDLTWPADRGGFVFQRVFQGTPSDGTPYAESGRFAFDPAFAGNGAPPDLFYFPADGYGLVLDRAVTPLPPVPYLDPTTHATNLCTAYTFYTDQTTLDTGWYVVSGDITNDTRIAVDGDVHLILCDGASLTANEGVNVGVSFAVVDGGEVATTNSLTIWAQSDGEGMGALTATGDGYQAGIGGGYGYEGNGGNGGAITINGGTITASGGYHGAGIGGGCGNFNGGNGGTVSINGGTITAIGGDGSAGIGGGYGYEGNGGNGGTVSIGGGTITATGGNDGAGIGGGEGSDNGGNGGTVSISGGTVTATGGYGGGAGIGGGWHVRNGGNGGTVSINGGTITATGSDGSAGIGGGNGGAGGNVTIVGGMVDATGGDHAAGIGGGMNGDGVRIDISGGEVTAMGGGGAAGIGGGYQGDGGTVTVKPAGGSKIVVEAGADADGAAPIDGSPFTAETDITGRVEEKNFVRTWVPPEVTDVAARQRWPWNGLVDIDCTVSGIDGTDYGLDFAVAAVMPDSSVHNATNFWVAKDGNKSPVQGVCSNGNYRLIWDARADLGPELYSNVVVRVTVVSGHARAQLWEGGPYWAMTNVGAEKPEDYGLYFWWGDTVGYRPSSSGTFDFNFSDQNSDIYTFGKDIATLQSGNEKWITTDGVLVPAHDAAQAHWGGAWRMPTKQDMDDLLGKCDWVWTTQNGVKGWTVTGRGDYASASIFLPCAGSGFGTSLYDAGSDGYYWSSVPDSDDYYYSAWVLSFYSSDRYTNYYHRSDGQSVRPVQGFTK